MPNNMMSLLPIFLFLASIFGVFLFLAGDVAYTVREFRSIAKNPYKHRPCPNTLPCGDAAPRR